MFQLPTTACYGGGFTLLSHLRFESYVNLAGSKAGEKRCRLAVMFESYVNLAGSKAEPIIQPVLVRFESYVNLAGSKADC